MQKNIPFVHSVLKEIIHPGDTVLDATCGNGNDTLMLAKACGNSGHVYAFDIQAQAINSTKALLNKYSIHHVTYIHDSHAHIDQYIPVTMNGKITAAIFNLGYLPRGDKTIITTPASTIAAIKKLLQFIRLGGRIALVIYHGHPGGQEEKNEVLSFVTSLSQAHYEVVQYAFLNHKNSPPFVIIIEKIKQEEQQ